MDIAKLRVFAVKEAHTASHPHPLGSKTNLRDIKVTE
jgi:uncharacterized protein YwbE